MKKILVTGSSGFIGKEFVKILRKNSDDHIYEVRRSSVGIEKEFIGDLDDLDFLRNISKTQFHEIYHFAWQGLPSRNEENSNKNLVISKNFVTALLEKSSSAQFNVLGSCLEYGDYLGPVSDDTKPEGNEPFSLAKIELHEFMKSTGSNFRWFRPFYVYGQGQRNTSLIPHLIDSFSNRKPVELKSYSSSHDFINVRDVAKAILLASKSDYFGPINIGTGILTSVGGIVKNFSEQFQLPMTIEYCNDLGLFSDSRILRDNLGWEPEFKGIQGMIKYYFEDSKKDEQ